MKIKSCCKAMRKLNDGQTDNCSVWINEDGYLEGCHGALDDYEGTYLIKYCPWCGKRMEK